MMEEPFDILTIIKLKKSGNNFFDILNDKKKPEYIAMSKDVFFRSKWIFKK